MSSNPYESPNTAGKMPLRTGKPTGGIATLLTLAGIAVILFFLILPVFRRGGSPELAYRMDCTNNLKQIALALHNYESEYGCLPPAHTVDADGKPLHSWRTLILPYLEQKALYDKIDLTKPWDDPANKAAYDTSVRYYRCRSAGGPPNHTSYLAIVGPGACFRATEARQLSDITDDHGRTLMVVEVDSEHEVHWMSPSDANEQWFLKRNTMDKSAHRGGTNAACADGSVHFLPIELKPERLRALISIDGDDDAAADDVN